MNYLKWLQSRRKAMHRVSLCAVLLLLFSSSVTAQVPETGRIGLWADESRSTNEFWAGGPYMAVEMWIWCQPGQDGMKGGQFAVQYPANVIQSTLTVNPAVSLYMGDLQSGISFVYTDCHTDWIWPFHQQLIFTDTNPSELSIIPYPMTGNIEFSTCLTGNPIEIASAISSFCYNQSCGPDVTPPSVDSLASLYADHVVVYFDEVVSAGSASTASNYTVSETANPSQQIAVSSATLLSGQQSVSLSLGSPMSCGTGYTVSVSGVEDIEGNAIATPVEVTTLEPCPLIGLYADDGHLTSEVWEDPGVPFEMYIWCKPNRWGMTSADFAIAYPPNVSQEFVTTNPLVSFVSGDLATGTSISFSSCQTGWVWPFHQTLIRTNSDPALVDVIPHPSLGGPNATECSGPQYQISLDIGSPLYLGTADPSDSIPPAIDSLVITGYSEMTVYFNEHLAPLPAENISNYRAYKSITYPEELTVTDAALLMDHRSVLVTVDHEFLCYTSYSLYVSNITDDSGNMVDPQTGATTVRSCTLPAVGCIGLYVDEHETSEFWGAPYQQVEMWIWCLPSENGMVCAEFAIEYPANIIQSTVTQNPDIIYIGSLPDGMSACFSMSECQMGWTWLFRQQLFITDQVPSLISIIEHPSTGNIIFLNCLTGNPAEDANICSHLYLNQSAVDTIPPIVDSVTVQSPTELILYFNDWLRASTAENASNYEVIAADDPADSISVLSATGLYGNTAVMLALAAPIEDNTNYLIRINNIEDDDGNVIAPNTEVYLYPPVDLTVSIASVPPEINSCADAFSWAFQIANSGSSAADSFRVSILVSADSVITAADPEVRSKEYAGLWAAGTIDDTLFVSISDIPPAEISYIGLYVDDLNQIIELIEDNNAAATPFVYNIPTISAVADYPGDQGRTVRITIHRSMLDAAGSPVPVTQYEVFRKIDRHLLMAPEDRDFPPPKRRDPLMEGWEYVGAVTANHDTEYFITVPTLMDSTALDGTYWSTFFARAATDVPTEYYDSCPDSGYSIDNIPPSAPGTFTMLYEEGTGNMLAWSRCTDADFMYYRIYRGKSDDFIPFGGNLVRSTTDTTWIDPIPEGYRYQYKITAVDYAGNEGPTKSSTIYTDADIPPIPGSFALHQNVPNPFNPTTTIIFDIPKRTRARLAIYSIAGTCIRVLIDDQLDAGRIEAHWNGRDNHGNPVASGIYFYRLDAGGFSQSRKMVLLR